MTTTDPLVIRSLEFLGGLATPGGWRPEATLPEIAFCGRSNVGKSSLLNKLVRRKAFARVSKTPGRTREINFFKVNDQFVLVDLPGYGYAKVAKEQRSTWGPMIDSYLGGNTALRGVVLLLDVRRDPSEEDLRMFDMLAEHETPTIVAVTKVDKLSATQARERIVGLGSALGLEDDQIVPFSAITGEGRDDLAESIMALISSGP